ncbi:uncharacterized protein PV09_01028 [Verruconis gallopava]|uniref:Uncharacterized protein n=1 Tax=Verruconis gallopava TaxID=253628 RepID=A0A0D2AN09_9PEZI|nr:uncharacterized protein PV09_01028 [Verruconis gallopava]KIW08088.1 hypothetical protein PV09_01028 [Verruconis gallopava]
MLAVASPLLALLVSAVFAIQPEARPAVAAPLRELPWSQLNILHTTDVHGWFGGHLQEPSFSADWGDYISFAHHLRKRADEDGSDVILVDTGDRIEGNGLYDGSDPKGIYSFDILKEQHIDLICSGNHELYKANSSNNEYNITVPNFKDSYLASNLDIIDPRNGSRVPLAPRYKKFSTKNQGIRVLAMGFLFDFKGNANNTIVQPVKETVKEEWFQKAIRDEDVDLILIFGHVAIRSPEYDTIFKEIRSVQWDMPVAFLGGHTHIRDYKKYDSKSFALESGRYLETIGFMSISGLATHKGDSPSAQKSIKFDRRYIDNNLFSLYHHSGTNETTFNTELGFNTSKAIHSARKSLKLNKVRGCAPTDLFVNRAPYPSNHSIFTWLENEVLPDELSKSYRFTKEKRNAIVLVNTGALRFDIFKGPFTRDTEYLVSPFTSGFRYVADVPLKTAKRILDLLNNEGPLASLLSVSYSTAATKQLSPPEKLGAFALEERRLHTDDFQPIPGAQAPLMTSTHDGPDLIPGYTTEDDAGTDGDDTIHSPITFWNVPNAFQSTVGFKLKDELSEDETVDVVYNEFMQPWVLLALEYLGTKVSANETSNYLKGKTMTDVMVEWIERNWAKNC